MQSAEEKYKTKYCLKESLFPPWQVWPVALVEGFTHELEYTYEMLAKDMARVIAAMDKEEITPEVLTDQSQILDDLNNLQEALTYVGPRGLIRKPSPPERVDSK